jgi:hypothetical protein
MRSQGCQRRAWFMKSSIENQQAKRRHDRRGYRSSCTVQFLCFTIAPALVHAGLVLGDVALVPALDHLLPRLQAVRGEPAHREDQLAPGDDVFRSGAAITEREFRADRYAGGPEKSRLRSDRSRRAGDRREPRRWYG